MTLRDDPSFARGNPHDIRLSRSMSRRALWLVAGTTALAAVLVAALIWFIVPIERSGTAAAVVTGSAATVQAVTALLIVFLTRRLADSADVAQHAANRQAQAATDALVHATTQASAAQAALQVARDQLDEARRSDRQARRDRQLLETPIVRATFVEYLTRDPSQPVTLTVAVENDGTTPALSVRAELRGREHLHGSDSMHSAESRIEVLPAGGNDYLNFNLHEFTNVSWRRTGARNPPGALTYPWLSIRLSYQALLGQQATEHYVLGTAEMPEPRWFYRSLRIDTSVEGGEPLELDFFAARPGTPSAA